VIDTILGTVKVATTLVALLALCAVLWWVVGATFGVVYLGFKFVTG
jgi:hypothetical protein